MVEYVCVCVARYFRAVKVTIRILRSARMLCCYSFYRCMWLIGDKDGGSVHRVHAFLFTHNSTKRFVWQVLRCSKGAF